MSSSRLAPVALALAFAALYARDVAWSSAARQAPAAAASLPAGSGVKVDVLPPAHEGQGEAADELFTPAPAYGEQGEADELFTPPPAPGAARLSFAYCTA